MKHDEAESVRKRYLYRRLIVTRRVRLPPRAAAGLIGPDCAYHLYSGMRTPQSADGEEDDKAQAKRAKGQVSRGKTPSVPRSTLDT